MKKRGVELSKNGYPVIWESGGAGTNTGRSQIICDNHGNKKTAIFVKHGGHLSNSNHALHSVRPQNHIIEAWQHRGDYHIVIWKVLKAEKDNKEIEVEKLYEFEQGMWDNEPIEYLKSAIEAAIKKAKCYHCRTTYYTIEKEKKII